jgi:prophage maintenance system killer protein
MSTEENSIIIYKVNDKPELKIKFSGETIWMSQSQIADLFGVNIPAITKHIKNIYSARELVQNRTVSKMEIVQNEGKRQVKRAVDFYNLDMIISVGYRVNSSRATQFRVWATEKLKELMLKGYALHEQRLKAYEAKVRELEQAKRIFSQALESRRTEGYEKELLNIITDYLDTWIVLNQYDAGKIDTDSTNSKEAKYLDYDDVKKTIDRFKLRLMAGKSASDLFGKEVGNKLEAILGNVRQSLHGREIYPSIEEKAAHLFYFLIKDHPFVDGNKRIGALLLLLFLIENRCLYNKRGDRVINDSALTALALLVAESKPEQKDTMVKLVTNLISKK